ncbi:methyl-accepting chemotaxis protein [Propionispira arboris]|uniref:Methyl-accepting chemotaxis protein n=1 Tax=Propionispira arboris TaxID=84035 RepID=A0A1H6WJQ3_9FIRM|nr:methyl-accepting chemotaxis protein [Propionispira arboris]SEJ17251.1 methyl-accepting chemotaxis protein [Propionispira arboris]
MFKDISFKGKVLLFILPVTILGFLLLSFVSYKYVDAVLETELLGGSQRETKEVAENIDAWLDARLFETQTAASNPAARNAVADPVTATKNNEHRFQLMQEKLPNTYDSVSWGYFDNSGVLWGQAAAGPKLMSVGDKAWYKETMQGQKKSFMSPPVVSQATGKTIVNAISLIKDNNNKNIGMVLAAIYVEAIAQKVQNLKIGDRGYGILIAQDGTFVVHPSDDYIMKKKISEDEDPEIRQLGTKMLEGQSGIYRYTTQSGEKKIAFFEAIPTAGWSVAAVSYEDEIFAAAHKILLIMMGLSIVVILLISLVIWFAAKKLVRPLQTMVETMNEMAEGDFTEKPARITTRDEFGMLAQAIRDMRTKVRSLMKAVGESSQTLAASSQELTATSEQSSEASDQVAASIATIAQGMTTQLAAVKGTTTAVEDLSLAIRDVSKNANETATKSGNAAAVAQSGGESVTKAIEQMNRIEKATNDSVQVVTVLGERSKEIGQIVDTISGIAGQTNLLALNAAIEAARAGETGRGFAVVAEEVRKLAEGSQMAAKQISDLIMEIQNDTHNAVVAMNEGSQQVKIGTQVVGSTGEAFHQIVGFVQEVSAQAQDISAAIEHMANNSELIVGNVQKIDGLSKDAAEQSETVSAATQQQAASMQDIANASQNLASMAEKLQQEVQQFKI